MRPSVGRIVHYTNLGDKDGKYPPQVQAAIITAIYRVDEDGTMFRVDDGVGGPDDVISDNIDVKVFYRTGLFDTMGVPKKTEPSHRGCWDWPPRA